MTFEIETMTKARLEDVRVLSQKNRTPDQNPGVQLPFSLKLSNHILSTFDGSLKSFLFVKKGEPSAKSKTGTLDGVEAITDLPDLSSIGTRIKKFKWDAEVTGCELTCDLGIGGPSNLVLDDCTVRAFRIHPQEGGTVLLKFIVEAPDASADVFAKLAKYKSREIEVTIVQHEPAQQELEPRQSKGRKASEAGAPVH